ncbi:HNH endonuclease [Paenibacillus soyae]|uniref:HNH endonuclease n=1 Tax=Paenibacillus soyae TaxID=2969249 RepID=A0A9X2SBG7_9BACL|nr:HNH endonuclease [Paenibacillus soyae]MCR2807664.1 HNH endonuclease [Paenibacillus soyae]
MNRDDAEWQEEQPNQKRCSVCGAMKPLGDFLRRTGRRSGRHGRRGTCRSCRGTAAPSIQSASAARPPMEAGRTSVMASAPEPGLQAGAAIGGPSLPAEAPSAPAAAAKKRPRKRRRSGGAPKRQGAAPSEALAQTPKREKQQPPDVSYLKPTSLGFIRMRGKTDNGRRWYQEVEPELAYILVREGAAVVVNRHTIRRLYSNKEFRQLILTRDNYTCRFCGNYGDTIDHELPRAKGGHTTPANCYCACYECNQRKANRDVDEFIHALTEEMLVLQKQELEHVQEHGQVQKYVQEHKQVLEHGKEHKQVLEHGKEHKQELELQREQEQEQERDQPQHPQDL